MGCTRREFLALASVGTAVGLSACTPAERAPEPAPETPGEQDPSVDLEEFKGLALDASKWRYDEDNDVYYQLGLTYCTKPATTTYESLAVFVPGAYLTGEKNGDTYTCTVNEKAVVGSFTPSTAPVLMPINTGTLSAQMSPTAYGYTGLAPYLEAGCVYVYAGFRGRSAGYDTASGSDELFPGGSPWPVVDLKAAIRYLRYNAAVLPCDTERVFVFGFGAGGGVSAVLGSSGGAAAFDPYLASIGAVTHDAEGNAISDDVAGSASWCPVTSFDTADAAYEWAMGQYASDATRAEGTWTRALSQGLAASFGAWVNQMDLRDADDTQLTLDETEAGAFTMGSYARELLSTIDEAATNFVQNTSFPYTYTPQRLDEPSFPGDPNLAATRASEAATQGLAPATGVGSQADDGSGTADDGSGAPAGDQAEGGAAADAPAAEAASALAGVAQVQSTIYDSAQNYFAALNSQSSSWWINYNLRSQSVSVSSLRDFALNLRPAELAASPFDLPDRSSRTNQLFGIGEESTLHFDAMVRDLVEQNVDAYAALEGWDPSFETSWVDDLEKVDALETDMVTRVALMNPLFWLSGHYEGYGQATVAPHWRINEGLFDTDTAPCGALNLTLALRKYDGVADVAYTPVWGQGHVLAERSGTATANLLGWVTSCCATVQ
ncbi:subtype A tannase [Olsenella sp. An290]|uniref:subtype A tannase n=1 Tax=Olsenella sp. An290 TaxID=1965625 RepID=UPI000B37AD47|nr:subtype A tannase [Olsenella sp. An290]OUO33735.1 tannase [Olsenella sp. An290]